MVIVPNNQLEHYLSCCLSCSLQSEALTLFGWILLIKAAFVENTIYRKQALSFS